MNRLDKAVIKWAGDLQEKEISEKCNIVIDTFDKNSQDEIKVILTYYKGALLLDIRSWRKEDAAYGAGEPTRKGLSISIDLVKRLKKAIEKAEKYLKGNAKEITKLKEKLEADNPFN